MVFVNNTIIIFVLLTIEQYLIVKNPLIILRFNTINSLSKFSNIFSSKLEQ